MSLHDEVIDWDPFGLEAAVKAGEVKVLRQSNLGTADTCLKRLEYDRDPSIAYVTGEARAVGTAYHRALEVYYRLRQKFGGLYVPDGTNLDDILAEAKLIFDVEAQTDGFQWQDGRAKAYERIERMVRAYFEGEHYWPDGYEVAGVEWTFLMPLYSVDGKPRWVVKGTLDLILKDPAGWILPVDHKSAKRPWKKGKESHRSTNQPSWYVAWLKTCGWTELPVSPNFVFDIMTYDGKFERRVAPVEQQHIDGVFQKADHVCRLIEQGGPYPPNVSSFLCDQRWCDHWNRCPFGQAFDAIPVTVAGSGQ